MRAFESRKKQANTEVAIENSSSPPLYTPDASVLAGSQSTASPRVPVRDTWAWLRTRSFSPGFLKGRWGHHLLGYLAALLLQVVVVVLALVFLRVFLSFTFLEGLVVLDVMLVARGWGLGPGVAATLVGAALLLPALWSSSSYLGYVVQVSLVSGISVYLVVGLAMSLVISDQVRERAAAQAARRSVEDLVTQLETERARLQAALAREQTLRTEAEAVKSQLEAVLEILPVGVTLADASGQLVQRNAAFFAIWGQDAPSVDTAEQYGVYRAWWTATGLPLAAEDWPLANALRSGKVLLEQEIDIESFDGQRKTILHSAVPIRTVQGEIVGGVVALLDITERKRLEMALRQSEQQARQRTYELEAIFHAITESITVYNTDGTLLQANASAHALLALFIPPGTPDPEAYSMSRHLRDKDGHALREEDWPQSRVLRGESLKDGTTVDVVVVGLDDRQIFLSVGGSPIYGDQGQVVGAVLVSRDITERRLLEYRTQEALEALLELAEAMVQLPDSRDQSPPVSQTPESTSNVAQHLVESIRRVLDCKRVSFTTFDPTTGAAQSMAVVGLSAEQTQLWYARQAASTLQEHIQDPLIAARIQRGEVVAFDMRDPAMQVFPNPYGITTALLVPMLLGQRLVGILSLDHAGADRTYTQNDLALAKAVAELATLVIERERLLVERAEAHVNTLALRETNRMMDEFIGVAGHELRTPLTTIKASVQLARRQLSRVQSQESSLPAVVGQSVTAIQGFLQRAERQVDMQNRLVSDLLDVSRIQSRLLELRPQLCDMLALVRDVIEDQSSLAPTRTIRLEAVTTQPFLVMADADRLRQVVNNYLSNALKYSSADRPVAVLIKRDNTLVRVAVRDEGPGLTPADQERVWERFYRVPAIEVLSGSGVGLGLGLHICRTLIERQQGHVGVESTVGHGSTFWFTLPLVEH